MEIWKDVIGYENQYQVSNRGRVRSKTVQYIDREGKKVNRKGKVRSLSKGNGYFKVSLKKKGTEQTKNVHVLVGEAFIGTRNKGEQYDHIDNNPANNYVDNLRIITRRQNHSRIARGKSKYPGVIYRKANKNRPWVVLVMIDGVRKYHGSYACEEEAYTVYKTVVEKRHPKALVHFEQDLRERELLNL